MKIDLNELEEFKKKYLDNKGELKEEYQKAFYQLITSGLYDFFKIFIMSMANRYLQESLDISDKIDKLTDEQIKNLVIKGSAKHEVCRDMLSYFETWKQMSEEIMAGGESDAKKKSS